MKIDVLPVSQNFRGMSYADWATIWDNWLISDDPDLNVSKDILFLRGNIDYKKVGSRSDSPRYMNPGSILDRTGDKGESIFRDTAIFIPVLTARYSIGELYDGKRISNLVHLRSAVNRDTDESQNAWANVSNLQEKRPFKIVKDLNEFRVESPLYNLHVPYKSKLRERTERGSRPGNYPSIVSGFFVLIKSMHPGRYRFTFGGEGRGRYSTCSMYDITVKGKTRPVIKDVSQMIPTRISRIRTRLGNEYEY